MVEYHHPAIRGLTVRIEPVSPPPSFVQTCSEVEEERDEFSPTAVKTSRRKHIPLLFIYLFFFFLTVCTLFTYSSIPSRSWILGGSVEQPPQDLNDIALNQPMPHPSSRIE